MTWIRAAAAITLALSLSAGPALAQTAPPFDFGDEPPPEITDSATAAEVDQAGEENATVIRDLQRSSASLIAAFISTRINRSLTLRFDAGRRGRTGDDAQDAAARPVRHQLAARDGGTIGTQTAQAGTSEGASTPWSVWATPSVTFLENTGTSTAYDGTLVNPLAGVDYAFPGGWVGGVSLGYERIDLDTDFGGRDGSLDGDGFTIVPYVGTQLTPSLLVDAGVGYTHFEYSRDDAFRQAEGDFDGDRVLVFGNLTAMAPPAWTGETLNLSGKLGALYAYEDQGSFGQVESQSIELGQLSVGGRLSQPFTLPDTRAPSQVYAAGTFHYDAIQEDTDAFAGAEPASDDRSEFLVNVGTDVGVTSRLSLNAEYGITLGREDIDSQTVALGLRLIF